MGIFKKEFMKDEDFNWSLINGQNFMNRKVQKTSKEKDDGNKDLGG